MFDDALFYARMAENTGSYGRAKCSDSVMFLAISKLDFEDDLLSAMDDPDAYLLDESYKKAA